MRISGENAVCPMKPLALLAFLASTAFAADTATLIHSTPLTARSTFEVRFSAPIVDTVDVGKAAESPLVIRPALAGTFTWLSQRSGVFTPTEPMTLNTTYQITLDSDLADADDVPLDATLDEVVETPAFQVKGRVPQYSYGGDVPAVPRCALVFNTGIDAAKAVSFVNFTDKAGERIPARLAEAKDGPPVVSRYACTDHSLLTWDEQFRWRTPEEEAKAEQGPRNNVLAVVPVQPLPPGEDWKLVAGAGFPSANGLRLSMHEEVVLGRVRPFEVSSVKTNNTVGGGRQIVVTMSKTMAGEVKADNYARWFTVKPAPANLTARLDWQSALVLSGDFQLHTDYTVVVAAGLPAGEPFVLANDHVATVSFEQIAPTVALQTYNAHQLATGARKVRINTVNVPKVRVVAKVFQADTVAGAEQAYGQYFQWNQGDGLRNRVEMEKLPGRTVLDREYDLTAETDKDETLELSWDDLVGPGGTGVAMITAEAVDRVGKGGRRPGAQAIVQLTDLGVVWKDAATEKFAYVFSLAGGGPVAGAKVQWVDKKGKVATEETTDAQGSARLPVGKEGAWLLVSKGQDLHVIDEESRGHFDHGRFHLSWDGESEGDDSIYRGVEGEQRRVLMFTDRPVYKPGETTHLKALVRDERPGRLPIAEGEEATLEVRDARDKLFISRKVKLSDVGAVAADIALPNTPLGGYRASLRFAGDKPEETAEDHSVEFRVEEYVPNAFEVKVETPLAPVGVQKTELAVQAKYYMGKPLSKAKAAWTLSALDASFAPEGWEKFTFCDAVGSYRVSEARGRTGEFHDQGTAEMDDRGLAHFASAVPLNAKAPQPRAVSVRCEVTDVDQQTVTNTGSFTLHSSDYYLGVAELPELVREGDTLPVRLAAARADGTPMAEPVEAQVRLLRVDWQTNRSVSAGYGDTYQSTPSFVLVGTAAVRTSPVEKQKQAWVIAGNEAPAAEFALTKPGEYLLEASAKDAAGRDVISVRSVYVYGKGAAVWNYRNQFQIDLLPDRDEYFAGDTATILVKTPISGDALVTVEREHVRRSYVVRLDGNAPSVKVPIEPGDAPNVYVSVLVLRGAEASTHKAKMPEYRVGYAALTVKRHEAELTVYAKPAREEYEPGQEVAVNVEVLDPAGQGVPNAEVTLYAVDEGVLSLMGYETPKPFAYFNQRRALAVDTGLTLPDLLPEDPEELAFGNKGYLVGDGGEEATGRMRKDFIACAYWNATLRTGPDGKLGVTFKAPDSLTRYRVIAVAQTARDQFGSDASAFTINKPVMVEAAPPRFGNVGDKLAARAVIHNTTEKAGAAVVTLVLDGTTTSPEPLTRTVALGAKGSLAVDFPLEFKEPGEAVWKWSVKFTPEGGGEFRDAMESRLKVGYPAPMLRQVRQGHAPSGDTDLLAGVDPALLEGAGVIRVSMANSRLLELREGVNQLLHYPYGCVEQTTSSTLPWITLRKLGPALPELMRTDAEVNDAIRYGVNRLFSMQTPSGGLAYWPGGTEPLLYASAWGGFGIAWAHKAGAEVPEEDFARLMKFLSQSLRGAGGASDRGDVSSQCLALFTLAVGGHAEPSYHELFFKRRGSLDAQQRAWLALAILEAHGPRDMVQTLLEDAQPAQTDRSDWWCSARTPATQLMAWSDFDGTAPAVDKLLTELMGVRRGGHWYTTQGNAWAVLGLGEYVQKVERGLKAEGGSLMVDGERMEFQLGEKTLCWTKEIPFGGGATPKVVLSHTGEAPLFTEVTVEARPRKMPAARSDRGYTIQRKYQRVADNGALSEARDLKVGDRVLVTLDVSVPDNREYLAVEDPLPANLEAINPSFTSQAAEGEALVGKPWQCDFSELRTDRALFFVNYTYGGSFYIRYLARVRAAGTATAPAAKVEEMYEPDRFGTTDTGVLTTGKWD